VCNTASSAKTKVDIQSLESLSKILGKRLRSKVLINNIGSKTEHIEEEESKVINNKRLRNRKD
jgi:hypothetical protein